MKDIGIVILSALLAFGAWVVMAKPDWGSSTDKTVPAEIVELTWDDLIPADFSQPENPFDTMTQEAIDKLLDGSEASDAELARLQEAFEYAPTVDALDGKRIKYEPVWAIGVLHADTVKSDLAEAGYRLEVESVLPYTE